MPGRGTATDIDLDRRVGGYLLVTVLPALGAAAVGGLTAEVLRLRPFFVAAAVDLVGVVPTVLLAGALAVATRRWATRVAAWTD